MTSITHEATAVVTGAGSGIGRAMARELARRGARVVCSDVDLDAATETVDLVQTEEGTAIAVACDVTRIGEVEDLAATTLDRWHEVTVVVNNAGIGVGGAIGDLPLADWRRAVDVNLWGVIHGCHVFTPILRAAGRGGILNVASAASFGSAAGMAPYNVTKAGVVSLSETLAAELAGTPIHVTALCPTFVRTQIVANAIVDDAPQRLASRLMGLTGRSADRVARIALDGLDRGQLYVMPQLEAKALWRLKRMAPNAYLAGARALGRLGLSGTRKE